MTCTDVLGQLTDYFDGEIDEVLLAKLNQHLAACRPCEVLLVTTQQTIEIFRASEIYEFPLDLRARIRSAIMEKCRLQEAEHLSPAARCGEPVAKQHTTITCLRVLYLRGENSPAFGQPIDDTESEA